MGLADCIERFERDGVEFSRRQIHDYSLGFSEEVFKQKMSDFVYKILTGRGLIKE